MSPNSCIIWASFLMGVGFLSVAIAFALVVRAIVMIH